MIKIKEAYALYRKCDLYRDWSIDLIFVGDLSKARAEYHKHQNERAGFAKLINLKQKIKKINLAIEEKK